MYHHCIEELIPSSLLWRNIWQVQGNKGRVYLHLEGTVHRSGEGMGQELEAAGHVRQKWMLVFRSLLPFLLSS